MELCSLCSIIVGSCGGWTELLVLGCMEDKMITKGLLKRGELKDYRI